MENGKGDPENNFKKSAKTFCQAPVQEVSVPAEECPWKADGCSGLVPAFYSKGMTTQLFRLKWGWQGHKGPTIAGTAQVRGEYASRGKVHGPHKLCNFQSWRGLRPWTALFHGRCPWPPVWQRGAGLSKCPMKKLIDLHGGCIWMKGRKSRPSVVWNLISLDSFGRWDIGKRVDEEFFMPALFCLESGSKPWKAI